MTNDPMPKAIKLNMIHAKNMRDSLSRFLDHESTLSMASLGGQSN